MSAKAKQRKSKREPNTRAAQSPKSNSNPRYLRWLLPIVLLLMGGLGIRTFAVHLYLNRSQEERFTGDVFSAEQWLSRSRNWGLNNAAYHLERAKLARSSGAWERWSGYLEDAKQAGASDEKIQAERTLQRLAQARDEDLSRIAEIVGSQSISVAEVFNTILPGVLAKRNYELAEQLFSQWREQLPEDANLSYWTALSAEFQGDAAAARQALELTLDESPRHQAARLALAKIELTEDDLGQAFQRYRNLWLQEGVPDAAIGLAEVYRRWGKYDLALKVMGSIDLEEARFQRGQIAMEQGDYTTANEQLRDVTSEHGKTALAVALHLAHRDREAADFLDQIAKEKQLEHARKESLGRETSDSNDGIQRQ